MKTQQPARALVTGASSGIGAALAEQLARRGLEVWLAARSVDALERLAHKIRAAGGRAHVLPLDVADSEQVVECLTRLDRDVGGIDLVVANAAVAGVRAAIPFGRASFDNTSEIIRTNLLGAVACLSAFVPGMLARGHGQLVAVSSIAAQIPNPRMPVYGATKAGLSFLLESIDMELRPRGIAVTRIEPGFVRTPAAEGFAEPMPFMLETDVAVAIIDRAIRRRARLVRFPWQLGLLIRLAAILPTAITVPVLRWLMAERPPRPA